MKASKKRTKAVSAGSIRVGGVASDITESQRAEEALGESQVLLKAIVDSTRDMIWSVDPETFGLLTFNRALSDYFFSQRGIRLQKGMRPEDLFPAGDFVSRWRGFYQRALSEGPFTTDYTVYAGSIILQLTLNLLEREGRVFGISVFGKDITERRQAEEALRESEERFRELVETSEAIVWEAEGTPPRITFVSQGAEKILGYPKEQWLQTPGFWAGHIHPEDRQETLASEGEVMEKGQPRQAEYRMKTADGRVLWFRDFMHAVSGPQGKVERLRGIMVDITESKRAEEQVALLKHSIDVHYDGAYWTDTDNRFIYVNDAGCKDLGYEREELIGKTILDVNPKASSDTLKCVWESLRSRGFYSSDSVHRRKDGSEFPVEIHTTYVRFGGREFACGFARDITERKRAEEALRESEARLKEALLAAQMGVWEWTAATGTVTWDENVYRIAGRDPKLPVPGDQEQPQMFAPESWERLKVAGENALATGIPFDLDLELIRPDGSKRWLIGPWGAVARCERAHYPAPRHGAGHHRAQAGGGGVASERSQSARSTARRADGRLGVDLGD
jgi:PAS domain S-box-containing protein